GVYVLALLTLSVNRFLLAALSAGLPKVVPDERLLTPIPSPRPSAECRRCSEPPSGSSSASSSLRVRSRPPRPSSLRRRCSPPPPGGESPPRSARSDLRQPAGPQRGPRSAKSPAAAPKVPGTSSRGELLPSGSG